MAAARINPDKLNAPQRTTTVDGAVRVALVSLSSDGQLGRYSNVGQLAAAIWQRLVRARFQPTKGGYNSDSVAHILRDLQQAGALSFGGGTGGTGNITRLPQRSSGKPSAIAAAALNKAS